MQWNAVLFLTKVLSLMYRLIDTAYFYPDIQVIRVFYRKKLDTATTIDINLSWGFFTHFRIGLNISNCNGMGLLELFVIYNENVQN